MFPNLSRKELALTICEHLNWENPAGKLKVNSCLTLLQHLENLGIVTLPEKRKTEKPVCRAPAFSKPPDESPIEGTLEEIGPITLRRVTSTENREDYEDFKAYLHRFHYLGYKHPFGRRLFCGALGKSRPNHQRGCRAVRPKMAGPPTLDQLHVDHSFDLSPGLLKELAELRYNH
jgi:hypothetical protein